MKPQAAVIIPAAGFGTRMQCAEPKQYLQLSHKPVIIHTVEAFVFNPHIHEIVLVVPEDRVEKTKNLLVQHNLSAEKIKVIAGGRRRQDSVYLGLLALSPVNNIILVHDGARPLISQDVIDRCYKGALLQGAVIAAVPVKDTLKKSSADGTITATINRDSLYQAQTPQAIQRDLLLRAYKENGTLDVTDEASLLEKAGIPVVIVEGSETNIKITRPEDLSLAEKILRKKQVTMRIGHGYDAHRFSKERPLVLGGITIPHSHGLAGHSDADVLTHALCDAILGATGAGDIGKHFPDSDDAFKDIYSIKLLEKVISDTREKGYIVGNVDITVVCQEPKLRPYIEAMTALIAGCCGVPSEEINIKATTTEKMGFTGRQEGISCHAVVLLQRTF
ncbi:2-C-methyl-D-erythritol 4-phosphate cytidylyltransferase [Desulforhopalus sp. IMCC35007]|uniref:2-C-methyl-D-erythritol 4-phosphate cytidylyltransferase n=1 Tax=Desulforhopalus sp. IMCC35007 TaxID=2569543 RepID=UPI0010ADB24A|nr:2-C-methyl-D-erythritol 4-phosphate cytidylyltransferase [Desulforhopalus sp. IMCC35007]TKB07667.1 2-C-methyl-D-erythritol 4-phosphate cytidylyltransferase [Desulforhopalus sp. IMCC35007]